MATLRGEPVDRPAVCFYELGGFKVNPDDPDPFNIYNDPSWRPLLRLAEEESDLIRLCSPTKKPAAGNCRDEFFTDETWTEGDSRFTRTTVRAGGRTLTELDRRDAAVDTVWTLEHLLKSPEDIRAFLDLPDEVFAYDYDVANLKAEAEALGERGIVMVDTGDPLCHAAGFMSMADFTVVAFSETELFHRLLEKCSRYIYPRTEQVARKFPGALWRICGAEYATEPYLPPRLFEEYEVRYARPMVEAIGRHGGLARIHCHGRVRSALPLLMKMAPGGIDPLEPPPSGDVELAEVRRQYGQDLVLFGNIEVRDIENMDPPQFEQVVRQSLRDGTAGTGRGFVLMPSAAPYGRRISARTLANYETMIRLTKALGD
jgi:hypothetical protein